MTEAKIPLDRTSADLVIEFAAINDATHSTRERSKRHEEAGGIHDDSIAQRYGYQGALVPGIVICAHTMPALVERWGKDWLKRGRVAMKHIRPGYDQDRLSACYRFGASDKGAHCEIVVMRDDVVLAVGDAAMPNVKPELPEDLPRTTLSVPEQLPLAEPDVLAPGQPLFTTPTLMDAAEHDRLLARIGGETGQWPYGSIHPVAYQHLTSHDAINSFEYSTPGIHVSGDTQMLDWAEPGETLSSSGRVVAVYDRKGHHYFETEQLVQTASGRAIALCRRSVIYRTREVNAAQ
ncbi:MAG: hypothetical protein IR164_10230 [Devosia sp.]|uniref:hypothetical protein n=1 Tax=Devosia sp. TaxID=1871048 RepID=UPI0019E66F7F|nr:hypothetical protein [Devosia sp.]MBF0679303.1 hypothetical protein [Devosia sp.]